MIVILILILSTIFQTEIYELNYDSKEISDNVNMILSYKTRSINVLKELLNDGTIRNMS